MASPTETPEHYVCPRCGKTDCDRIPPEQLEKTIEFLRNAPRIEEDRHDEPDSAF